MPKTLDPENFDIHAFEKTKPEVYPASKSEKIDPRTLQGIGGETKGEKHGKGFLVPIAANIVLPGLGNVVLKKSTASISLLAVNLLLLVTAVSPFSLIGFVGVVGYPTPWLIPSAAITASYGAGGYAVTPPLLPIFYLSMAVAAAA